MFSLTTKRCNRFGNSRKRNERRLMLGFVLGFISGFFGSFLYVVLFAAPNDQYDDDLFGLTSMSRTSNAGPLAQH